MLTQIKEGKIHLEDPDGFIELVIGPHVSIIDLGTARCGYFHAELFCACSRTVYRRLCIYCTNNRYAAARKSRAVHVFQFNSGML